MLNEKELKELMGSITPFDELYYKGVMFGDFGKRKTSTALRCSQRRAILLHADRGWNIIRNHPDEFNDQNVIPIKYEGLTQVKAIVEAVVENQEPFNDVDLIILDTISQMQEKYIDFLGENFTIFGREKATPKPGSKEKEITLTGLPDYHLTRNKMRPVVELLVAAPVDVLFLAHVREPSAMDIQKGKLARRPNVTEAVFNLLARDATFIGFMEAKKDTYTITFKPSATLVAKSQIKQLTDQTINSSELPKYLWDWKTGI
jgi:hypothetical protein